MFDTIDSIHAAAILEMNRGLGGRAQLQLVRHACVTFEARALARAVSATNADAILRKCQKWN